ncbi:ZINC FINGER-CONTAINING PROTEIN P48ZNF [Salix koriyanagi]|uniref:ZINC FINGER-CONTAINING PROTEIN P48ZNF n=1 Tax=Salix koriyanagi TaxID=2511006 RepID=A0A9Q0P5S1_9ROSI|nr:ZINC FINGER-CONTAINING PROTEIN P48ZNF [Salix koriyanagi]
MDAEKEKQANEMPKSNPLTQAQFLLWKRQKDADSSARKAEATRKREEDIAAGTVQMNGRELFLHEPWVFDNSNGISSQGFTPSNGFYNLKQSALAWIGVFPA